MAEVKYILLGAAAPPLLWLTYKTICTWMETVRPDYAARGLRVVITGSSRGVGYALANKFLDLGDSVLVSSRSQQASDKAAAALIANHSGAKVFAKACNVADAKQAEALADFAQECMGGVDLWVNNAGVSQSEKADLPATDPAHIRQVVETNLLGSIYGSRAAVRVMHGQDSGGKIFLMDGTGAWGNPTPQNVAYGATKRGLTQLKASLAAEVKGSQVSVHIASPGMVATDLLLSGVTTARAVRAVNILAEEPSVVAAWLAPRMRGVTGNGRYFKFLTPSGVLYRFLTARSRRGRFLPEGLSANGKAA